jgi:hypothetical protein
MQANYKRLFWIAFGALVALVIFVGYALTMARTKLIGHLQTQKAFESNFPAIQPSAKSSAADADIPTAYLAAPYAPFALAVQELDKNESRTYAAIFITNRGYADPQDGHLNTACGGYLTGQPCYVFLESWPVHQAMKPKLLAKLEGTGAVRRDTIKFAGNEIRFKTGDGDAGFSYEADWSLNIETNELKRLSYKESNSNER